jgi:hypothetical protein
MDTSTNEKEAKMEIVNAVTKAVQNGNGDTWLGWVVFHQVKPSKFTKDATAHYKFRRAEAVDDLLMRDLSQKQF